jgi:DNA polymerase III epsilon subunit-like protein
MTYGNFDPPSDPEGNVRVCRNCDQALEEQWGEWVCVNRRCKSSTRYDFIFDAHETACEWARDLLKHPDQLVILDAETTGLGSYDEVCQVAMIDGSGNVLMENQLVKPTIHIPIDAYRIHGITDEMVRDAPRFTKIWGEIYKHMDGKILVIYNADFDARILRQSARAVGDGHELGFPFKRLTCAMNAYSEYVGEWNDYHGNFRWQRLPGGDHTALGDCRATLELIRDMAAGAEAE